MTGPSSHPPASDGAFVVVHLGSSPGEASDLKSPRKYSDLGDDVELGSFKGPDALPAARSKADDADAADGETVCRVCHLGFTAGSSESIVLGCACKQDLAHAHRDCAEEWFKIRGNTVCEICGETAKNVRLGDAARAEATTGDGAAVVRVSEAYDGGQAVVEGSHNGGTTAGTSTTMSRLRYLWANQLIRNSLLATMIVVFMVPWFFRIAYF